MKIENSTKIKLNGPLSRNNSLKNIKTGDIIKAKILKKIDKYTAVIDLKGNKVKGKFNFPVPESVNLFMEVKGDKNDTLILKIIDSKSKIDAGMILEKINVSPEMKAKIINYILRQNTSIADIFSVMKKMFLEKKENIRKIKIIQKYFSKNLTAQLLINRAGSVESDFLVDMLKYYADENIEDYISNLFQDSFFENEDFEDILNLFKNEYKYYGFKKEKNIDLEIFQDKSVLLLNLKYSQIGSIDIMSGLTEKSPIIISITNDDAYELFNKKITNLYRNIPETRELYIFKSGLINVGPVQTMEFKA